MRSASKRGRRSRPSSLALEEQGKITIQCLHPIIPQYNRYVFWNTAATYRKSLEVLSKRTRSAHSSPAAAPPTRSNQSYSNRRQDHITRLPPSGGNRNSHNNDSSHNKEPSPIPEVPFDEETPIDMPQESKVTTLVETVKRRGSRDSKRLATPLAPLPKVPENDDQHISDLSSLSELDDSEAETERLEDSPRKGAPKSVFAYTQGSRSTSLKNSLELKPTKKGPDVDTPDDGESQPVKKRKWENGDVSHKEVNTEEKTSRPVTPLTAKNTQTLLDKGKKSKAVEAPQEKQTTIPMEGIESEPSSATVNGDENHTEEDHTEPEPTAATETAPDTEHEDESKDPPTADHDVEVDEEVIEGAEVSREDEEGS